MTNGQLVALVILGLFIWLGSLGGLIAALGGWGELTKPEFIGAALGQLSGVAVMVFGALGIKLPPKE